MKGEIEMMVELGKAADHFGGVMWRRGKIGRAAKKGPGPKALKAGTFLRNRYKVERFLFWDGRYNHYVTTIIGGNKIYELREFPDHQGIEGEMEILAKQVFHRGIQRRYDFFIENNRSYVVLEYQEAPDLENSPRVFSASDILWIAYNLVDTLDCLHRHGIAHVDLSSRNIKDMGEIQKIADLSNCRLFGIPSLEGFMEARERDFLELVELLEKLIMRVMDESEDPSLLDLIRALEEMVDRPPLSAEDFKGRLSRSIAKTERRDEGISPRGMSQHEEIPATLVSGSLKRHIAAC
jgi:serine/threonine protein kinase